MVSAAMEGLVVVLVLAGGCCCVAAAADVPAMFAFGDSLIDNGNNNDLPSFAKANYLPYGIDFAGGPTGRFSNGYTIVDELADLLGLPLLPANAAVAGGNGGDVLHGVNYASAAAGILDATGQNFVSRIPFNQQIKNFEATVADIGRRVGGPSAARDALGRCLFYVGMGSNDYLNNYLMPNYDTRSRYSADAYSDLLVQQLSGQLQSLYKLGARKFIVAGIGSMACIPNMRARNIGNRCSPDVDGLILPFNSKLQAALTELNSGLPRAQFVYVDAYSMISDILRRPFSYGFTVTDRGCCGIGRSRGQITCLPFQTPCPDRDRYVFWDAFHPTAKVNVEMARMAYSGEGGGVYPMSIRQLADLDLESN